jgi:hypothetical protein
MRRKEKHNEDAMVKPSTDTKPGFATHAGTVRCRQPCKKYANLAERNFFKGL